MLVRAPQPKSRIAVFVASDQPIARVALSAWLRVQPSCDVAAEAGLENAPEHIRRCRPQVVLLHCADSYAAPLNLTQRIRNEFPTIAIVVVAHSAEQAYVRSVLLAGASGYVLERGDPSDLVTAIAKAARGSTFLDPSLSDELVQMVVQRQLRLRDNSSMLCFLSEREEQVLRHVALGYTHKEIAALLSLSAKTVNTYRSRILEKTNLRSRAELVRYAMSIGLLSEPSDIRPSQEKRAI
ncbi:MAG: LuxR C-terminal-related transcriptional regulator [Terriglobales bacterium]